MVTLKDNFYAATATAHATGLDKRSAATASTDSDQRGRVTHLVSGVGVIGVDLSRWAAKNYCKRPGFHVQARRTHRPRGSVHDRE
jgi:hypothetical protein